MKKYILHKFYLSFFLFSCSFSVTGQINNNDKDNYKWFDNYIGIENTGLFNGLRYKEVFRTLEGNHKFYLTSNFLNADITYDGQSYFDIKMKYDLYDDQIIVNLSTITGDNILQLIIDKIEKFSINNKHFVKLNDHKIINSSDLITGIYETLYDRSSFILYKKNKKNAKKHLTKNYVYYTFKNNNLYYCHINENYYPIKSKSDWIKIFPKQKKEIQSFYRNHKILLRSNFDSFLIQLSDRLNNINSINTSSNS